MTPTFSVLPFGNLCKQALTSATLTPITASNIVTAPPQAAGQSQPGQGGPQKTTPLDMGAASQSPQSQSVTEQALGVSPETLQLQQEHAELQKSHEQMERQLEDAKRRADIAKQQASLKAAPAKDTSAMDNYKSMSMQMMSHHLKGMTGNLKGLSQSAGALPMQLKLAAAFMAIDVARTMTKLAAPQMLGKTVQITSHCRP